MVISQEIAMAKIGKNTVTDVMRGDTSNNAIMRNSVHYVIRRDI